MNNFPEIKIITDLDLPRKAHNTDACVDITANIDEPISLCFGEQALVDTGIRVNMPETDGSFNWVLEIVPRSGFANKHGITITNSPAQIDENYTGPIKAIIRNTKTSMFKIEPGMRIAQMKLTKSYNFNWVEVDSFEETDRGESGLGSTGH